MGCCFSHESNDTQTTNVRLNQSTYSSSQTTELSREEKRARMAAAAENRQKPVEQQAKDQKQILLGKIDACYAAIGEQSPIGLASCDIAALQKHLEHVKKKRKN